MSDELSFLSEEEPTSMPAPEAPEPQPEPEPAPQPEPEPEPQPEPAPPEPPQVPLEALHGERERRRRAEQEAEELRRRYEQQQAPEDYDQGPPPPEIIALNVKLDISQQMAEERFGAEAVNEGLEWFKRQSPALQQELRSTRHPYGAMMDRYQREKALGEFNADEWSAFKAWKAAQSGQAPAAAPTPAPTPAPAPKPPPSIVSAPSAGGVQTQVAEDPFEAEFKRK